jgi:hypothetical protein
MRTLAKRSWREAENRAQIHLANVSTLPWRGQVGGNKNKSTTKRFYPIFELFSMPLNGKICK